MCRRDESKMRIKSDPIVSWPEIDGFVARSNNNLADIRRLSNENSNRH